ncbi:hypothetical protein B296_00008362 [Ensete ventricosum]|uniref:Uncharacterized protein n=1 Tax=Ensete ventricosum TaxID=4639 RepID=A0A426ZS87_ENSVE|nr:hypothetical protein B296_00008362 [Ensete ventricosum]
MGYYIGNGQYFEFSRRCIKNRSKLNFARDFVRAVVKASPLGASSKKDDGRFCDWQFLAWKGGSFFSHRLRIASRAAATIGAGFTTALQSYDKSGVESVMTAFAIGDSGVGRKGGGFFSPRRLTVSWARDAMDASGQTRHFSSHAAPLFQRDTPPLASSQWPPLVASQRNAPLQQSLVPSQREHSQ